MQNRKSRKCLFTTFCILLMLFTPKLYALSHDDTGENNSTNTRIEFSNQQVQQQSKTLIATAGRILTGTVVDSEGEPLPGVNVFIEGSKVYAITDADGHYTIRIPAIDCKVTFSYVGMKTEIIECKAGKNNIQKVVKMQSDTQLEEVVVTGLFNYRTSTFTGSATTFSKEDLKVTGNSNILKSLVNLDPSFIIDNNSLNGSNPNSLQEISIRGNASFSGLQGEYSGNPNEPLFILDGFEATQEQIFDLDMNRVKSITTLKDATAKAIYGSKAANGVVVVETIEPEAGRLRLTYTGDLNLEAPDLTSYDLCNAAEKLQVEWNAGRYSATSPSYQQMLREQYNELNANIARGVDTYWLSQPLRTGVGHKHSLYLEGGTNEMRYSATVNYNNVAGVMKESGRTTMSGNIKLSYRYKKFMFRNSLTITSNKADNSPYGVFSDYVNANPYYTPYDENGNLKKVLGYYQPSGYGSSAYYYYNPLYNAFIGTKNFSKYTEYTENFYIEYRPNEAWRFTGRVGYTHKNNSSEDFKPGDHTDFVDWTGDNFFKRGSYSITDGESSNLSADLTANFTHSFGKHLLLANAAWSLNSTNYESHGMTAWGFLNNHVDYITFAKQYADNGKPTGSENTSRSIGITSAFNYSYDERYLVDLSVRFNGSSVFGSDNRWGTFWSAGLGWNIHKEAFMQDTNWINLLKLRASYGLTGNQNFNPYQAKATYKFYDNVIYDNITGAYLMALANNNLKWQQTADFNIGLDATLWKALNLRVEYYNSNTKDALLAMSLPTSTGFTSYQANLGNVENKGFEATVSWRVFQNQDSFLTLMGSVGHNVNKVKDINDALYSFNKEQDENAMNNALTSPTLRYEEGQSMTAIWAVKSLGIDPATGQELFQKKDGSTTYEYSTDDYIIAGDTNPKYHGTFGLTSEYKGIGLNCTFSYQVGGDIYNQTLVDRVENVNIANNVDRRVLNDTWKQVGDIATFKRITSTPTTTYPTTRFVERNNQLDLASLSCYYDFKHQDFIEKLKLERLRISFYMNNVFHLSTVKAERGLSYPYARSFSFSISATL